MFLVHMPIWPMGKTGCGYLTSPTQLTRKRLVSMIPQDMPKMFTCQGPTLSWETARVVCFWLDVSDAANPQLAGEYETPGFVWSIYISDSYAYVANGEHGMLILRLEFE